MKKIVFLLLLSCFTYSTIVALESNYFKLNLLGDTVTITSGVALTGTGLLWNPINNPYKGFVFDKDDINSFDRGLVLPYSKGLDITGDVLQYLTLATPLVLLGAPKDELFTIGVMYFEAVLFSIGAKEIIKNVVSKARPYMYYENPPSDEIQNGDYMRSFPSGHTTLAFTGATFTTYLFTHYFPDSKWKVPVIAGSFALATSTAVSRILSGNHFLSDVIVGALIGSASGFIIPWVHSLIKNENELKVSLSGSGFVITLRF